MSGQIDPFFADHPEVLARKKQQDELRKKIFEPQRMEGRPAGSNADEWHLFLSEYLDNRANFPTGMTFIAVQIAEAIDAAERRGAGK